MQLPSLLAATAALSIGLSGLAFADDFDGKQSMDMIGVDVTQAGSTDEQRMAYWKSLPAEQSATAQNRCRDALNNGGQLGGDHSSNVYQFCVIGIK